MTRRLFLTGIGIIVAIASIFALTSSAFAASGIESVRLTGPDTITIVYTQAVYTSPGDYSNLTGSFNGYTVNSVSGSGTNIITLTLSGSAVPANATGYITIGTSVQDVSDSQYFPGATWNISDAIGPAITSYSMSSSANDGTFAGTNDTITVSFNTNEQVTVQSMTIAGHSVSVNGGGTGPYTANYEIESGDTQQSVPVALTIADTQNNQSQISFSFNVGATSAQTSQAPIISQVIPVASTVTTATPSYTFYTTEGGSIEYSGSCVSPTTSASVGNNTVTFNALANGTYNTCTISVIDSSGRMSNTIAIPQFIVDASSQSVSNTTSDSSALSTEIASLQSQLSALEIQEGSGSTASTAASSYNFTQFLGVGSEGADVTALQEQLTTDGFFTVPVTGYYGTLTEAAVEKFQSAHGIDVKGYVGPNTRTALNAGD